MIKCILSSPNSLRLAPIVLDYTLESVFLHSPETSQASLSIGPKAFYPINVTMLVGKFITTVLHSVMFLIAKVYKTIITTYTGPGFLSTDFQ